MLKVLGRIISGELRPMNITSRIVPYLLISLLLSCERRSETPPSGLPTSGNIGCDTGYRGDSLTATRLMELAALQAAIADSVVDLIGPASNWEGPFGPYYAGAAAMAEQAAHRQPTDLAAVGLAARLRWRAAALGEGHIDTMMAASALRLYTCLRDLAESAQASGERQHAESTIVNIEYFIEEERFRARP